MATSQPLTPSQWPPLFKVLCTLLVLGNGIALFSKIAVWMRGNKPSVCTPPELFVCSWEKVSGRHVLSTSVACFWSCIVCRRSPDLGLLSSSGEIFLYLVFTFFSFIVSRMNAGLTNWNLIIMEGFQRHRLSPISLQESYKNTLISI